jgi:hypothetical protein
MKSDGPLSSLHKCKTGELWPHHLLPGAESCVQAVDFDEFASFSIGELQDAYRRGNILVRGVASNTNEGNWSHETLSKIVPPGVVAQVQCECRRCLKNLTALTFLKTVQEIDAARFHVGMTAGQFMSMAERGYRLNLLDGTFLSGSLVDLPRSRCLPFPPRPC